VGAFDEKKQKSKISCKCTFKEEIFVLEEGRYGLWNALGLGTL
jgi:hypothetical protein